MRKNSTALGSVVDEMGKLDAQIANLTEQYTDLRAVLLDAGDGAYEGKMFRATVSTAERAHLNSKAAREKLLELGYRKFVKDNTLTSEVTSVRVVSRSARELAA